MKGPVFVEESAGYQYGSGYGVEAVSDCVIPEEDIPYCSHGPTILFERFFKDKESRKFFACSACRNRKECTFFQPFDEKMTPGKKLIQDETKKQIFKKGKKQVLQLADSDSWCYDCDAGFTFENKNVHVDHNAKVLSKKDLKNPTFILNPSENKKAKAQYFFDEAACQFFLTSIKRLQYKNVICIGTPRLFELVRSNDISTILLDLDSRYEHFYSSKEFFLYNLFTHFFFDKGSREKEFKKFALNCKAEETLIILDPPFGGLLNVIEQTLSKIWGLFDADTVPTMIIFPYFLESHVNKSIPSLLMHDYKVSYSNHPTYRNTDKQGRGSPVRIFTNITGDKLSLPKEDYKFCKTCQRYVYKENRHCKTCNACTSKDGRAYVHCDECKKCVKPGSTHCETCQNCKPENHKCDTFSKTGCHVCGEGDHKRRDCPQKIAENQELSTKLNKKRKSTAGLSDKKKKKKKKSIVK